MEKISNELSKIIISNELSITGKVINNLIINGEIDKFMIILNNNNNDDNTIFHYKDIYDSNTLLHVAVLNNHECCIKFLLEKGIDINSKNKYGNTALNLACRLGYEKCIESLLFNGADIYIKDSMGCHPINMCIIKDNEKSFELLVKLLNPNGNDNTNDFDINTLLHTAAISGKNKYIPLIYNNFINDIDINSTNNSGNTALIEASVNYGKHYIRNGKVYEEVISTLLDIGADVNIKNHNGYNAFHYLASHAKDGSNLISLIRRIVNKLDHDNATFGGLIHTAVYMNYSELVSILFDSFIDRYISYQPYKSKIYTLYFPNDNILNTPPIVWTTAELIREKYYFDEIFFYVHMYVANIYASNRSLSNYYAKSSDKTSTLMVVLTDRLKSYLKLTK